MASTTSTGPRVEVLSGQVYPVIPGSGSGKSVAAVVTKRGGGKNSNTNNATTAEVNDGVGKIFVSIASYRDAERCAQTIRSIFENAKYPQNIIIGLVEQNSYADTFCLSEYCKFYGIETIKKDTIRAEMEKIVPIHENRLKCPYYNQIRLVAFHDINAKGPMLARSLIRKVLGNEEYCLQLDAHSDVIKQWDESLLNEWEMIQNDFAIISNIPAPMSQKDLYGPSGTLFRKVPRQCEILFRDNGFPDYQTPADGFAIDLEKPLLSHTWSAAFSFSKCHLEESTPYDPFLLFSMPIEQFSRYARFWTRGYDVYTPTRNIVFHDYSIQSNGHGNNEWFKRQKERFRKSAIARVKTFLQMTGGNIGDSEQANLGIYGLGKRRSLQQLQEFVNVDLLNKVGNIHSTMKCVGHKFIPYDASISPTDNLFAKPDHLDPQPEYPLRTHLKYYQQVEDRIVPGLVIPMEGGGAIRGVSGNTFSQQQQQQLSSPDDPNLPAGNTLLILWIFGLMVWCTMFVLPSRTIVGLNHNHQHGRGGGGGGSSSGTTTPNHKSTSSSTTTSFSGMLRKKKQSSYKDV